MARLDPQDRGSFSPEGKLAYDHIVASRGQVSGPFTVLVHSPEVAQRVGDLGAYVRFESDLPADLLTISVLNVARMFNCSFEWAGWTRQARDAGVPESVIEAIRDRRALEGLTEDQALVVSFGQQLLGPDHRLDQATYEAAVERFGVQGTVDLAMTYGYFSMLSFPLNTFEVDVPEGGDVLPL